MPIYHKPLYTIRQSLVNPKDKLDKMGRSGIIYEISCGECDHTYIGETGRVLKVRFKEHTRLTPPLTAVGEHRKASGHSIPPSNLKVLDSEDPWYRRKIKEHLFIKKNAPSLNRDRGFELPAIYNHIVVSRSASAPSHVTQQ